MANQERRRHGDNNMQQFLGDVYAVQGKFADAARIYKKIGQPSRAMTMYTDLRMFDLAKVCLRDYFFQLLQPFHGHYAGQPTLLTVLFCSVPSGKGPAYSGPMR